jgi:nitrate/nitrite transporter NarK
MWVFLGPVIGALVRPVGGWFSDKINSGAKVTAFTTMAMIIATFAVAFFIIKARATETPEQYWWPFFISFMVLFLTTGIGNGSTFRSIPYIFRKEQAGPVLGVDRRNCCIWFFYYSKNIWSANRKRHTGICALRICRLLFYLPGT